LRITGGTALNQKLKTPGSGKKENIRPTSDRVREALFSILGNTIADARVLDLFSGTGSLGIEALSRGASSVVFVDLHPLALELIRTNLRVCFRHADAEIIRLNLAKELAYSTLHRRLSGRTVFDLVFLDPPYEKKLAELTLSMVEKTGFPAQSGFVIAEERSSVSLPAEIGSLSLMQNRRYGETGIWIYRAGKNNNSNPDTINSHD